MGRLAAGSRWWKCVYVNEFCLLLPVLAATGIIRTTALQVAFDVLRTLPLLAWATVALVFGAGLGLVPVLCVAGYTAAANIAMYAIDARQNRKTPFLLDSGKKELLFVCCMLSPSSLLLGSPMYWTNLHSSRIRYVAVACNLVAVTYLASVYFFTVPYINAWGCYPHPRDPSELRYGYCPQHFPDPRTNALTNNACLQLGAFDGAGAVELKRCEGSPSARTTHDEMSAAAHTMSHVALTSLVAYAAQIPGVLAQARLDTCAKLE